MPHWRWWLPPALLALALALIFIDPFAGDWDALDYTVLALRGQPSSMVMGRILFIFTNRALYALAHLLFALPPGRAYLLFKYAVVVQSPFAVIACWTMAREYTGSLRSATIASLLVALSPFFVIYSGQAMTEIPSILLLAIALTVHLRGLYHRSTVLIITGAALLAMGVNIREGVALYAPWLLLGPLTCGWKLKGRDLLITAIGCSVFIILAFGPFAVWFLGDVGGYRAAWLDWAELTRVESSLHPVQFANFKPLLLYFLAAAPLALIAFAPAAYSEFSRKRLSPLLVLGIIGLSSNLLLIGHYSVVLNGRYMLTGLPGLAPLTGDYLLRLVRRITSHNTGAFSLTALLIVLVNVPVGAGAYRLSRTTLRNHAFTLEYRRRLGLLPPDAVVIPGEQTVSVTYWRGIGDGQWDVIGTGEGWPGERLPEVIQKYLQEGRRVFLDADPRWWTTKGWRRDETRETAALEARFHFRKVWDSIYEIRPLDDATATDDPMLWRLYQNDSSPSRNPGQK